MKSKKIMRLISRVFEVGLYFLLCLPLAVRGQTNQESCPPPSTNCAEGSVTFGTTTISASNACIGDSLTATSYPNPSPGSLNITTYSGTNCVPATNSTGQPISPSYTWQVNGVTASPQSGNGTTASFACNSSGTGSVTFTALWGSVCGGGTLTAPSPSVSFVVHYNDPNACTPPTPVPANPVGLPGTSISYQWYTSPFPYMTVDNILTGTLSNVTGNETYAKDGNVVFTGCGASLVQSFVAVTWSWSGTYTFPLPTPLGTITSTINITGSQVSSQIFNSPATPYTRWYGQVWDQNVTPISGTFNGNLRQTWDTPDGGGGPVNTPESGTMSLASGSFLNSKVGTVCSVSCCPTLPQ